MMLNLILATISTTGSFLNEPVLRLNLIQTKEHSSRTTFKLELSNPKNNPLLFYAAPFPGREFHIQAEDAHGEETGLAVPSKGTQTSDIFVQFRKLLPKDVLGGSWPWARFVLKPKKTGVYYVSFTYDVRYLAALSEVEKDRVYYKSLHSNKIRIHYSKDGRLKILSGNPRQL